MIEEGPKGGHVSDVIWALPNFDHGTECGYMGGVELLRRQAGLVWLSAKLSLFMLIYHDQDGWIQSSIAYD